MVKINFRRLQIPVGLKGLRKGQFTESDIAESLADTIYIECVGIRYKRFAEKIFDSTGEIELTDEEVGLLSQFINSYDDLFSSVRDGIELIINNQNKKKNEKGKH